MAPRLQRLHRLLRPLPIAAGVVLAGLLCWAGFGGALDWPDATWLQQGQQHMLALHAQGPWLFSLGLFVMFTLLAALALPGCSLLAMAAGATLGWGPGTALVALASTAGATVSFLAARHWWRDAAQRRWGHRLKPLQDGLARDGALYLLVLRLVPLIPFPVLNPLMGLSAMPVLQFAWTSLLGMLLGSAAFVYAGTALGRMQPGPAWASVPVLLALTAALLLPLAARHWWRRRSAAR
jgi:uncharacterized membrane protein YdjX (TVP38/TMEM64 family)